MQGNAVRPGEQGETRGAGVCLMSSAAWGEHGMTAVFSLAETVHRGLGLSVR